MDVQRLIQRAKEDLARPNYPIKKMVMIHTGVSLAVSLVLSLCSFLLGKYGDSAGGLGTMGLQTVISSVQMLLPFVSLAFSPFWQVGMENVALGYAEGIMVEPRDMLSGFRRWRAVLSSSVMLGLQYLLRGFVASFLAGQVLVYTPIGYPVYQAVMQQMKDPTFDIEAALEPHMPMLTAGTVVLALIGFALLALPVYYRYRMVNYEILQDSSLGGLRAMMRSSQRTYRQRKKLFKIDLHFWWIFAANLLLQVVAYGDLLLELVGVTLPFSADVATWVFLLASMAGQVVLFVLAKPLYEVTWARAYLDLAAETPVE